MFLTQLFAAPGQVLTAQPHVFTANGVMYHVIYNTGVQVHDNYTGWFKNKFWHVNCHVKLFDYTLKFLWRALKDAYFVQYIVLMPFKVI